MGRKPSSEDYGSSDPKGDLNKEASGRIERSLLKYPKIWAICIWLSIFGGAIAIWNASSLYNDYKDTEKSVEYLTKKDKSIDTSLHIIPEKIKQLKDTMNNGFKSLNSKITDLDMRTARIEKKIDQNYASNPDDKKKISQTFWVNNK